MDDHLYPEEPVKSALASWSLGVAGMATSQGLVRRAEKLAHKASTSSLTLSSARVGALYTVAVSCVLVWRGTWLGWDCLYEYWHPSKAKAVDPGHATHSGLLSHSLALTLLLGTGLFASVLAPPAQISVLRDVAVRSSAYQGPAQSMVNGLLQGPTRRSLTTSRLASRRAQKMQQRTTKTTHARHHP